VTDDVLAELKAIRALLENVVKAGLRDLLTRRDAAKRLGVARADLDAWIAEGRVKAVDIKGRVRVSRTELERIQREGVPRAAAVREPTPIRNARGWKP
jgi:excisionase family DNA binding protein